MAGSLLNEVDDHARSNGQISPAESRSVSEQGAAPVAFPAVNKQGITQRDSNATSRNSSARASPHVDSAAASTQNEISHELAGESSATSNGQKTQPEALDAAGSYGTRSRRTGNQRLNYAEDQDMDFEFTSAATTTSSKKAAAPSATNAQGANTSEAKRAKESATNLTSANGGGAPHSSANHVAKEAVAATSNNSTANPKKRKAAGTPSTSTPPAANASVGGTNMRRTAAMAVPSALARETNMMTFVKSRACLNKKGELSADDGTKIAVNGKHMRRVSLLTFWKWRWQPEPHINFA